MITITRSQVRRLRVAFRRAALGIAHRGHVAELVLRSGGGQLRAQHRYCDLAVEFAGPGPDGPEEAVALPLDALADFEGTADTPVTLEAAAPDRTVVRWEDRGIPQSVEYHLVTPLDQIEPMPALPASWAANPGQLLDALAEATETGAPGSTRYALEMIQLRGHGGRIAATDGRQLLVRSGFRFPWSDDLLIQGRPIFGCRVIPRDQPVEVGTTDTHVVFRAGPWTISCVIQRESRFPDVERVIPAEAAVGTRLRLDPEDARFLESALDRLPGAEERYSPVTLDLNGVVAVRAAAPDQPARVTELVLSRSAYTGSPLRLCTNRALLRRALHLGFAEIGFSDDESPFVCRDASRLFVVQPLEGGAASPEGAEVTRIESGSAHGERSRGPARPETPRRPTAVRESSNGHEPARLTETREPVLPRASANGGATGSEQPGTSLAALIQEAESLHAALADARSRTARLIAGLRRQRKQSRLLSETLRSLRQLRLVESAG